MPPTPLSRYARVAVAAWDATCAAGDARAAWSACRDGAPALIHDDAIGWHGRVGGDALALAEQASRTPWAAIARRDGALAFACADSKGDIAGLTAALAGAPARLPAALPGMLSLRLASRLGIGIHLPCPTAAACSTGLYALLDAADLIERGTATRALIGAADASLDAPWLMAGFAALGVTCGDRRPSAFAGDDTGFAPAAGAGMLALADIGPWRLVAGVRLGDAGHATRFADPRTLAGALEALWAAAPAPDLVVTHGTGTAQGDAYERTALDAGPWAAAARLTCKPVIGHCLGASAAVELALALEAPARRLWKIGLGFGGHLAAVALERT
ncbi:MAG TPA: beta-ketoacyl synthase N-terminal-like domain-containing protein [Planctomycetota bacterium]|nr:beta-ketoacyl synthase N-terminal-like domain-containing protein [Planctomycetota bacterium]